MNRVMTLLSALSLMLAACNRQSPAERKTEAKAAESSAPSPAFAAPDAFKAGLGKVYAGYAGIASALAEDDADQARSSLQSTQGSLRAIPAGGLDGAGKAYWDTLNASFTAVLGPMAASANIAGMRSHFADFSRLMVDPP